MEVGKYHQSITFLEVPDRDNLDSSLCLKNKAFNYALIAWKIRSVYQFSANQKE